MSRLRWAAAAWLLGAACAPSPAAPPQPSPKWVEGPLAQAWEAQGVRTPEEYRRRLLMIQEYRRALLQLSLNEPVEWEPARQRLLELTKEFELNSGSPNPADLRECSDRRLLELTSGTDAAKATAAREELGRRGRIIHYCWTFTEAYDLHRWEAAKKALLELGEDARTLMALAIVSGLVTPKPLERAGEEEHLRYYLAELGPVGFQVLRAYFDTVLLPRVPDGSIAESAGFMLRSGKLDQCVMALIQLSGHGREYLQGLTRSPKSWVRRSVALSIGALKDVGWLSVLERYVTSDPDPDVRTSTYRALGRLEFAREEAAPLLLRALAAERDEVCLEELTKALVELRHRPAVPKLVELLDHPDYPVVLTVMRALQALVRPKVRLLTPAEWKEHWARIKEQWK